MYRTGQTATAQRRAPRRLGGAMRIVLLTLLVTLIGLGFSSPAGAHPLGNFTINTSAGLRIGPDEVVIDYVIDEAEIPTFQARTDIDQNSDDKLSSSERDRYAKTMCRSTAAALDLSVDDRALALEATGSDVTFPKGQAGLDTMRIECQIRGATSNLAGSATVTFADGNFNGRLGWHEVTAVGDRTTIRRSDVPKTSTSDRLRSYPKKQINSPLDERTASVTVKPGGPAAASPDANAGSKDRGGASGIPLPSADRFAGLVRARTFTIPFALFALTVSFVLGGFHALAPGHGKTVMAAYLVGQQGARRQALILGATVAFTHTGGVIALALVATNSSIAPERFYPILGSVSGVLVVGIGVVLLRQAIRFRKLLPTLGPGAHHHHYGIGGHTHDDEGHTHAQAHEIEGHGHDHDHDGHTHAQAHEIEGHDHGHDHSHAPAVDAPVAVVALDDHPGDHGREALARSSDLLDLEALESTDTADTANAAATMDLRGMMAMGFAGGLVPSPSALVVLLGSIAIGRAWFGLVLILAYGAGLAVVLVGAGLLIERLRHRIEPLLARRERSRLTGIAMNLPVITAVLVVLGGCYLVVRALGIG